MLGVSNYILFLLFILRPNVEAQQGDPWDLPKNLIPMKYTLTLISFLEKDNLNFSGDIVIEVCNDSFQNISRSSNVDQIPTQTFVLHPQINCVTETDRIVLHAKDLTIGATDVVVKMLTSDNKEVEQKVSSHGYGDENDFYLIVMVDKLVPKGVYLLSIKYKGNLNESLNGYYFVSYEQGGETK